MKFEIKAWLDAKVLFTAELAASYEDSSVRVQMGAAVKAAYQVGADLQGADLQGADLTGANLQGADLTGADLQGADLQGADLTDADLQGANLTGADLTGADLTGANLTGADLTDADLQGANLTGAYLTGANLTGADLTDADLQGWINIGGESVKHATPEESVANLDKVREIVLDNEKKLDMGLWHDGNAWRDRTCAEEAVCGTSHCLAGWLQVCATDPKVRDMDPQIAGIIQAPVAAKMFFRSGEQTLAWLKDRKYAEEAKE